MNLRTKTSLRYLVAQCLGWLTRTPGRLRIMTFHSVAEPGGSFVQWSPAAFDGLLSLLVERGFRTVRISDLVDQWPAIALEPRVVALTFDDGLLDNWTVVCPLLQKRGLTATFYVPTAFIGPERQPASAESMAEYRGATMLSWADVRAMAAAGFEIGSHSHRHAYLRQLSPEAAREEAVLSKSLLEEHLGRRVRSFAYPKGHTTAFAPWTREVLVAAGYDSACTMMGGPLRPDSDLMALPRNGVAGFDSLRGASLKLDGWYDCLRWLRSH